MVSKPGTFVFVALITVVLLLPTAIFSAEVLKTNPLPITLPGKSVKPATEVPPLQSKPLNSLKPKPAASSQGVRKSGGSTLPLLDIKRVYLQPGTNRLFVVVGTPDNVPLSLADFNAGRLYIQCAAPVSRTLSQPFQVVDPRRTYFRQDVSYNTGITLNQSTPIRIWFSGIAGGTYNGELPERINPAPAQRPASAAVHEAVAQHQARIHNFQEDTPGQPRTLHGDTDSERSSSDTLTREGTTLEINPGTETDPPEPGSASDGTGTLHKEETTLSTTGNHESGTEEPQLITATPEVVRVGGELTVRGMGFGSTAGRIALLFEGHHDLYNLAVQTWHNMTITATIPQAYQNIAGYESGYGTRGRRAQVLVYPGNGGSPLRDAWVTVVHDPALYQPVVRVSSPGSAQVAPSTVVTLIGENLKIPGAGEPHIRIFQTSPSRFVGSAELLEASRERVTFRMPSGNFIPGATLTADYSNGLRIAQFEMTFVPSTRRTIVLNDGYRSEDGGAQYGRARCRNRDWRRRTFAAFQGQRLINGFKVVGAEVEILSCSCADYNGLEPSQYSRYCEVEIVDPPVAGSNNPQTGVAVRFKPDFVQYNVIVTIEGPAGARVPAFPD